MSTKPTHPTRREALLRALKATAVGSLALPVIAEATPPTVLVPAPEPEFVPENDYPFFGYEPGSTE
jgi:hypothetical protein